MTNSETSSSFSIFALDFGANWNSFRFSHAHTFQVITTIGILFDLMLHTIFLNTDSVNRCGPSRGGKRLHSARISFLRRWFIAQTYTWLPDPVPPCTGAADLQPINTNRFMTVTNVCSTSTPVQFSLMVGTVLMGEINRHFTETERPINAPFTDIHM